MVLRGMRSNTIGPLQRKGPQTKVISFKDTVVRNNPNISFDNHCLEDEENLVSNDEEDVDAGAEEDVDALLLDSQRNKSADLDALGIMH